jgi:hypothetical protein
MTTFYLENDFWDEDYSDEEPALEKGWYFYGEDGPDCPFGPYDSQEQALEGHARYMEQWYSDNV